MELNSLIRRAVEIRRRYAEHELQAYGRSWTNEEIALGFVGDVGDLVKLIMADNGVRMIPDAKNKLAHELADCLWSVFVLAHQHGVDLEQVFLRTMDEIERHLDSQG